MPEYCKRLGLFAEGQLQCLFTRYLEAERRAFAFFALDRYSAAVSFHEALADREAHADAALARVGAQVKL